MRGLSRKRKDLFELAAIEEARAEEARKEEEQRKAQRKEADEARPPAVGAHGVAKQDGSVAGKFMSSKHSLSTQAIIHLMVFRSTC